MDYSMLQSRKKMAEIVSKTEELRKLLEDTASVEAAQDLASVLIEIDETVEGALDYYFGHQEIFSKPDWINRFRTKKVEEEPILTLEQLLIAMGYQQRKERAKDAVQLKLQ